MAKTQVIGRSTKHSTLYKKSFCWFSFLEKGNLFSLCFEIWGVIVFEVGFALGFILEGHVGYLII
jgi:hypothetical protein